MKTILSLLIFLTISFTTTFKSYTQCQSYYNYSIISQDSAHYIVQFSDSSLYNSITHYHVWLFGDGSTDSSQANPTHIYPAGQTFWACLAIYDSVWNFCDTMCQLIDPNPQPACVASFWHSSNLLTCSFYDNSTNATSWSWDFGDGSTSTIQNPTHTYSQQGTFHVCLTITKDTCSDTYCDWVYVGCDAYAHFYYYATGTTIHFYDNADSLINPLLLLYSWNFGDGNTSTLNDPVHTYSTPGNYNVCLIVQDTSLTCADTFCNTITVNCIYVNFSINHVCQPKYTYSFTDNTVGNITHRLWEFGDGQTDTTQNPIHTFPIWGNYNVCLTVTNDSGCTSQQCNTIHINCCEVDYSYYFSGSTVIFDPDSMPCGNSYNYSYHWDFGDGTEVNQNYYDPNVQHTFSLPGTYTVCLSTQDTTGGPYCCTDTLCKNIVVVTGDTCANLSLNLGSIGIRPQIATQIIIQYCNYGNINANNASFSLNLNSLINPISATPSWSTQVGNTLTWNLGSVPVGQCGTIYLNVVGAASLQAGEVLCSYAQISSVSDDCDLINNSIEECINVINSFDPNDKLVASKQFDQKGYVENDTIFPSDKLDYIIHFQNTGTAPAVNIFIYDTLNSYVNLSTVFPGASSHPYDYFEVIGNVIKWSFLGINLPDSNFNEAASNGFVKFSVSQNAGNIPGTVINNDAGIVFDFNVPVMTNNVTVLIDILTSVIELTETLSIKYYPNPVKDDLFLILPENINSVRCEITDMAGRFLYSMNTENTNAVKLSLKHLATGTYKLTVIEKESGKRASVLIVKQ